MDYVARVDTRNGLDKAFELMEQKEGTEQLANKVHSMAFAQSVDVRQESLRSLIKTRSIHKAYETPEFKNAITRISDAAACDLDETDRLVAIAQLARILAVVKKSNEYLVPHLTRILQKPIPTLSKAIDADDRYYVAQTLEYAAEDWARPYIVSSILAEESGEKARSECVRIFLRFSPSLSDLLSEAGDLLETSSPFQDMKSEGVARRLKRILHSMSSYALDSKTQVSEQFGGALSYFLQRSFRRSGAPDDASVSSDLANEIIILVHEAIRANFFISAQAETYKAIKISKGWFLESHWPDCVSETIPLLEKDVSQAIALLAKQGIADDGLLEQLVLISGSKVRAKALSTAIADEVKGLRFEIDQWLRKMGSTKLDRSSDVMTESALLSADQNLAFLLIDASSLVKSLQSQSENLISSIRVFEPDKTDSIERLFQQIETLINGIESISRKRKLKLRGNIGDTVEFSPNEHEFSGISDIGSRYVRIIRPAVGRTKGDTGFDIVVKAQVEPENSKR